MKKITLLLACSMFANMSFAQTTDPCETANLKTATDIKNAEACVLHASDYILTQPLNQTTQQYVDYRAFILSWMDKTPDYSFGLNENIMKLCKEPGNEALFGVYLTCHAKAAIKAKKVSGEEAIKLLVKYILNVNNQVNQTALIKELEEAQKSNNISKYIK